MAACSFYVSYPMASQFSTEMMNGPGYVRDELIFDSSQCTPPVTQTCDEFSFEKRSSLLQDYFKSANALSRSIMLEKTSVEQQHSKQWTVLSDSKRDELVDEHFVPNEVREQYEGGLIAAGAQRRRGSRQSLDYFSVQDEHFDDDQTDGISMSQSKVHGGLRNMKAFSSQRSNSAAQLLDPVPSSGSSFQRSKLRSFSIRSSKKSNGKNKESMQQKQPTTAATQQQQNEVIPSLFTRDVYELDNDVDLPDETLLTDHIGAVEEDAFARLKPLRYSFGRKMRNKITHSSPEHITSDDGYVISNDGADFHHLGSSMQDLTQIETSNNLLYSTSRSISTQDLSQSESPDRDSRTSIDLTSPIHMVSDDTMSIASSRPGTRTPDSSLPIRMSPSRNKSTKEPTVKHPLSRSQRAGSSYMTVTSNFADSRRQMFKKKKCNSTSPTREGTPVNMYPATSPPPMTTNLATVTRQHPPLKLHNSVIPIVKTESVNESIVTTSSSDFPSSPISSPPSSPAGLCPNTGRNKRESGYISSNYQSDDEESPRDHRMDIKRKPRRKTRTMQVERTESFNN